MVAGINISCAITGAAETRYIRNPARRRKQCSGRIKARGTVAREVAMRRKLILLKWKTGNGHSTAHSFPWNFVPL